MTFEETKIVKVHMTDDEYTCLSNTLDILTKLETQHTKETLNILQDTYENYNEPPSNTALVTTNNFLYTLLKIADGEYD